MKKRVLAMLLIAVMVMTAMTACTKKTETKDNGSKTTPAATSAPKKDDNTATPTPNVVEDVTVDVTTYKEAPILADKVAAGTLPKVEERIPDRDNIFVETNDAAGKALEIGTYGGVINMGPAGGGWGLSRPTLESIIRYNTDGSYYPNVIKSYEYNSDYTVWTFHLREGMKWSDGDDFNADDITFWYYMCHLNNFDGKKSWAALKENVNGEEAWATLTKVDDYTVTWTFVNPKYPADFIMNGDFKFCWAPSHYLKDVVPNYEGYEYVENPYWPNPGERDEEAVRLAAQALGISGESTKDIGKAAVYNFWNTAGIPTLSSFVLLTGTKEDPLCVMERNPYFWKVDAAGNQLPYVDAIHFNATSADGQDLLMFRSGDLDIFEVAMKDIASVLQDMGNKAELRSYASSNWGSYQITFNYATAEPHYSALFANPDFRQAMSICVDREQVSQLLSDGFLEPGQCAPAIGNFGYDAEWETKWTEYDVNKAKQLLEGCGLVMGADGFYTFADGTPFMLTFLAYDGTQDESYPVFEQYFKAAGINCALKNLEVGAFDNEVRNTDWVAVMGPHTAIGGLSLYDRAAPFVPVKGDAAEWYGLYGKWYETNGDQGVEPTGDMKKLIDLYEQWAGTPDSAKKDEIALKIYEVHKQNLWSIAYLKSEGSYTLINSKIKNYANNLVSADLYQYANIAHFEVLFKAE